MNIAVFHKSIHLEETQLKPLLEICPFCSGHKFEKLAIAQINPDVYWTRCIDCKFVTVDRYPTSDALDFYYSTYYKDEQSEKVTFDNVGKFSNHLVKNYLRLRNPLGKIIDNKIRILDFGGGDGAISLSLARRLLDNAMCGKVELVLCEIGNVTGKSKVQDKIDFTVINDLDQIDQCDFDIIIASAVIEHIPEVAAILKSLTDKLRMEGIMYIRAPYMVPFKLLIRNLDLTFPAHVHDFSPGFYKSLSRFLNISILKSNPAIVETVFLKHPFITLASVTLKMPWYVFGKWPYVGGWEVFIGRTK